jgi:hypothetical protein
MYKDNLVFNKTTPQRISNQLDKLTMSNTEIFPNVREVVERGFVVQNAARKMDRLKNLQLNRIQITKTVQSSEKKRKRNIV